MERKKNRGPEGFIIAVMLLGASPLMAAPLLSDTWGFRLDLPEGYSYAGGDGKSRFSFNSAAGETFDLVVYPAGVYASVEALARDAQKRLDARGDISGFDYRNRKAALLQMNFSVNGGRSSGQYALWGLCVELDPPPASALRGKSGGPPPGLSGAGNPGTAKPLLLALAYGPAEKGREAGAAEALRLSALDSVAPSGAERRVPGPVTEFAFPRGERTPATLAGGLTGAFIHEHDAEAAQALVDREFEVLKGYVASPLRDEAWKRFYRVIYRDSFDRLVEAAFILERNWTAEGSGPEEGQAARFAARALKWVQDFSYERNLLGSDFVNLVSAATEGRGDCDSRALLWAILLEQANIPGAIMVSREYSHAMGLADVTGPGARFTAGGKRWLVAETTAKVDIGLIGEKSADPAKWLGIIFE